MNVLNFIGSVKGLSDLVVDYERSTLKYLKKLVSKDFHYSQQPLFILKFSCIYFLGILFSTRSCCLMSLGSLISLCIVNECLNRKIARSTWMVIAHSTVKFSWVQPCWDISGHFDRMFSDVCTSGFFLWAWWVCGQISPKTSFLLKIHHLKWLCV